MNINFCIVIPIYKENLDCIEEISLKRLYNIIGKKGYDVYLLKHKDLNIKNYKNIYPNIKEINIEDKYFFTNTKTYSHLLISKDLYKIFEDAGYHYMYIYQLDCYLFCDKLQEWCEKRYDYIGAPIFSENCGWKMSENGIYTYQVGNGGFSLRRISIFYHICSNIINKLDKCYIDSMLNEDIFFCQTIKQVYSGLIVPDWRIALKFSLDMSPDLPYDNFGITNFPMAAHAIGKNIRFYKYYIDEFKNQDIVDYCENKYKTFFKRYYTDNWRSTVKIKDDKIETRY